jgi:hypothetical protein
MSIEGLEAGTEYTPNFGGIFTSSKIDHGRGLIARKFLCVCAYKHFRVLMRSQTNRRNNNFNQFEISNFHGRNEDVNRAMRSQTNRRNHNL